MRLERLPVDKCCMADLMPVVAAVADLLDMDNCRLGEIQDWNYLGIQDLVAEVDWTVGLGRIVGGNLEEKKKEVQLQQLK